MKNLILCILLVLFLSFGSVALAQEKSYITVERNKLNNGVVVVDILKADRAFTLQCNQGAPGCVALNNGRYQMVELPKNFGMYECKDVEVYPAEGVSPEKKLGEYCLTGKQ